MNHNVLTRCEFCGVALYSCRCLSNRLGPYTALPPAPAPPKPPAKRARKKRKR